MTVRSDWEQWEEGWRVASDAPADVDALLARTKRARRAILLVRLLSIGLTLLALAVVAAALWHAGNAFERTLGVVVSAGIIGVWVVGAGNQRRAIDAIDAPADEYRATRMALCHRQIRFAQLGWAVVVLDLAFLVPWWIGGIAVHGGGFHAMQIVTTWLPLASMAGFVGWTMKLRRRARAEIARLVEVSRSE